MPARGFLTLVGGLYVLFAVWCAVRPNRSSKSVGLSFENGSGFSEHLAVYGGLQLGLGILFLYSAYSRTALAFGLFACLVLHACKVAFRLWSLLTAPSQVQKETYVFTALEALFALGAAALIWHAGLLPNPTDVNATPALTGK